jgi:hypothetical protein
VCTIRWIRSTVPEPRALFQPEDASSTFRRNVTSTEQRGVTSDKEVNLIKNLIDSTHKRTTFHRLRTRAFSASICHHVRSVFIHCCPVVHEQIKDNALRSIVWVPPAHATSADRALSTLTLDISGAECTASLSGRFTPGKGTRFPMKRRMGASPSRYGR